MSDIPADVAAENHHLRGLVRRLEEDLAVLQERYAYAMLQLQELSGQVPAKGSELRVGVGGVNDGAAGKRTVKKAKGQSVLPFPSERAHSPEAMAKKAVARMPTTVSGHRVKMTRTLFLPREVAEYIAARAIREGKNTAGVIAEILGAESRK